jgi:hypothetical protein
MIVLLTLWLRFLAWPVGFVGLLSIVEFIKSLSPNTSSRPIGVILKVSAALTAYGIGSVVPYLYSREFLREKSGEIDQKNGVVVSKIDTEVVDLIQISLFIFFIVGLLFWVGHLSLSDYLLSEPLSYPVWGHMLWVTGLLYFLAAGFVYVFIRRTPIQPNKPATILLDNKESIALDQKEEIKDATS